MSFCVTLEAGPVTIDLCAPTPSKWWSAFSPLALAAVGGLAVFHGVKLLARADQARRKVRRPAGRVLSGKKCLLPARKRASIGW